MGTQGKFGKGGSLLVLEGPERQRQESTGNTEALKSRRKKSSTDRACRATINLWVEPAEMHLETQVGGGGAVRRPLNHQVRQRQEERRAQPELGTWQAGGSQGEGVECGLKKCC